MASTRPATVPEGWQLARDATYDSIMEREFTRITYTASDGTVVRIATVQGSNSLGGWGYVVWTVGSDAGELGLVEMLDEATELADAYMQTYECEDR
ncbi:hypothetical protein [Halorussus salinisoli]|uniref:hypothetical protein n=1 Tax=Halorussus salinisoli TaxID=2558242 RepID=UPI0010C1BD99|nr:hypothetical protein [Halorussus salinisoli]